MVHAIVSSSSCVHCRIVPHRENEAHRCRAQCKLLR